MKVMSLLASTGSFRSSEAEVSEKSANLGEPRQEMTGFQGLQTIRGVGATSETLLLMARTSVYISQYLLGFRYDLSVAHYYPDTLGAVGGGIVQQC